MYLSRDPPGQSPRSSPAPAKTIGDRPLPTSHLVSSTSPLHACATQRGLYRGRHPHCPSFVFTRGLIISPTCSLLFSATDSKLAVTRPFPVTSVLFITEYASISVLLAPQCEQPAPLLLASRAHPTHVFHRDNDVLQERVLNIELYYERARQKLLVPTQRVVDFDSDPPSETGSDAARQDALLATCPSDVFQILSKVLSLSPERASAIQAAHATNRPPIPLFLLPDHYYYIDRDGDPCVTPALLALLPSVDEQVNLLKIVKDVFTFQPLGSHDDLVRRVDLLRNAPSAVQEPNPLSRLNHLALYAIATGAFALAAIGSARPTLSSTRAINLYTAGRRALQLVTSHPQLSPNLVDHLWSGALLLQFLLFSHRLTGGEQPDSGVWHRDWVRAEIRVVLGMVIQACEDREANQSLQQSVSNDAHSRDLREWAKLACAVYYYEM